MSPQHTTKKNSMIFKTKNNELAILGKTLTETKGKLIEFFEAFERGGIKGQDGIIDTFFSKNKKSPLTPELLANFERFKKEFNSTQLSAEALAEQFGEVDERIVNYAKTCKNGQLTTEGFTKALKQQTLGAKAAAVGMQALAMAGNMLAFWAITKVLELAVKGIDELAHSAEHCKERVDELMSSYQSALDRANSNAKTVEDLASRYEELSKGVNNLGETYVLTTEEATEYHEICNQIADMFPTLISGYDSEGNAILSLKGNVEQLRDAYKEAQQEAYNMLIVSGKDSDGNDILKNASNILKDTSLSSYEYGNFEKIKFLDELIEASSNIDKMLSLWNNSIGKKASLFSQYSGVSGSIAIENLTPEQLASIRENAKAIRQQFQVEINTAVDNVQTLANAYLMTNEDYAKLDEQSKNAASIVVNSINENIASGFKDKIDVGKYVSKIVDMLKDNPDIKDALVSLLSLDMIDTPISEAKELIDIYIGSINKELKEDPVELKIRLGVDDIDDSYKRLQNSIRKITDDHGQTDRGAYKYLESEVDFNSFTQAQVELWLKATLGAENATQAVEMYKAALKDAAKDDPVPLSDIFSLKGAEDTLTNLGKISESIDTIQNAYKTLNDAIDEYNESGAFSIDTLQSVMALGDDWFDYLVDEEGKLKLDKESLEQLTQARLNDMRVQAINNVIDNVSKIQDEAGVNEYLASTNYALADSYEAVAKARLSDARASMQAAVDAGDLSQSSMDAAMKKATADIEKINELFANTSINGDSIMGNFGSSGSGGSSSKSEFSETIDFFEHRVNVLDDALSHLKSTMDNVSGSFGKNNLVDAELGITGEKFRNYTDALAMYTEKANEALSKLPADIASKIKDGAVALTDFIGGGNKDVVEVIKEYKSWADKITDCKQQLTELKTVIRQLELEKFNNIIADFQDQFNLRDNSKDLITRQIDLLREAGQLIGESFFTAQIDQSKKQLELLETEKAQLIEQMSSAISSGRVKYNALLHSNVV